MRKSKKKNKKYGGASQADQEEMAAHAKAQAEAGMSAGVSSEQMFEGTTLPELKGQAKEKADTRLAEWEERTENRRRQARIQKGQDSPFSDADLKEKLGAVPGSQPVGKGKGLRRMSSAQYRDLSPVSQESEKEQLKRALELKRAWVHISKLEETSKNIVERAQERMMRAEQALLVSKRRILERSEEAQEEEIKKTKAALIKEGLWNLWSQTHNATLQTLKAKGKSETSIPLYIVKLMDD